MAERLFSPFCGDFRVNVASPFRLEIVVMTMICFACPPLLHGPVGPARRVEIFHFIYLFCFSSFPFFLLYFFFLLSLPSLFSLHVLPLVTGRERERERERGVKESDSPFLVCWSFALLFFFIFPPFQLAPFPFLERKKTPRKRNRKRGRWRKKVADRPLPSVRV